MPNHSHPSSDATDLRGRMAATGIGFAGIDGAWWLPAVRPFDVPETTRADLRAIGAAMFALFDILSELHEVDDDVRRFLDYKVRAPFRDMCARAPVLMVRPDFQLVPTPNGYRLVATEIEACPAALGFAHAMQVGYGLHVDLVDWFARFLRGRPLLIVATGQWSEFLFEMLAFCRALGERGVQGRVLLDEPLTAIAADVTAQRRWVPPMFGIRDMPAGWNVDVLGRIREQGLERYLWPAEEWPENRGEGVVYRFGYFDCFARERLSSMTRWQESGTTFLNPLCFFIESKAVLATLAFAIVRDRLAALNSAYVHTLDSCLPETRLECAETSAQVRDDQDAWVLKYAGFDGDNRAWGGRSLVFGRNHTKEQWRNILGEAAALPWPVVAQRLTPSAVIDIDYFDDSGDERTLQGTTRLRAFLLRDGMDISVAGAHLTVSAGDQVSEATNAVQAPIHFMR